MMVVGGDDQGLISQICLAENIAQISAMTGKQDTIQMIRVDSGI